MTRVLVFHTAFPGDIVLTLPLVQRLRTSSPDVHIAMVTTPLASQLLLHHPAIDERIVYDKKGRDRGPAALLRLAARLRNRRFDVALIPHRSMRSAVVCRLAAIPRRIGFSSSAGRLLLTDRVEDDRGIHEISRNMSLLGPLGIAGGGQELPALYPGRSEQDTVDRFLADHPALDPARLVAIAPGSVWNTKRWPSGKFAQLLRLLLGHGMSVVLIGGEEDRMLCEEILATAAGGTPAASAAGILSLLGSGELIRRCRVCVSNDSAPMHLAVAVRTPVTAVFGATVPEFGFGPAGPSDTVVQTNDLDCRPCSIHGGKVCPIGTLDCMHRIDAERVFHEVIRFCQ